MDRIKLGGEPNLDSTPRLLRRLIRLRRHVGWARAHGIRRLIEEDQLDPVERIRISLQKARWRRSHDNRPEAVPVFLIGLQRSGTNMLARGFERAPEFEVRNENDHSAFERFRIRPLPVIRSIVERSRHAYVLFKPLCDSHRACELLDELHTPSPGLAIWAYRGFEGRVRSSTAKFGDSNLRALQRIASGEWKDPWQAGGLSHDRLDLIRSFDLDGMTAESGSALFWFLRNSLFFDLKLDRRPDVALISYDATVTEPESTMRILCAFLHLPFRNGLIQHIQARDAPREPIDIDPDIRARCADLQSALDETARNRAADIAR
jgi:hypothetical protein